MTTMQKLRIALARFRRDEEASLSVETVIIFPLLVWCYLGMFTYFDAFRSQSLSDKAAYTIADMLSRETNYVTPAYMNSLYELHGVLTRDNNRTQLRVSVIRWNDTYSRWQLVWSKRRGGAAKLTNSMLRTAAYVDRLPGAGLPDGSAGLPHNEQLILVETWTKYEPVFDLGLAISPQWTGNFGAVSFDAFVPTRPRFAGQVCWNSQNDGDATTERCGPTPVNPAS